MILVKQHEDGVVALCDSDLIGKDIEYEMMRLDITERFYKGEEMPQEKMIEVINNAKTVNIVGKEAINFALKYEFISKDQIIYIGDVPHAQLFKIL